MANLSTKELFVLIAKDLGVPGSSMDKFVDKLEGEFLLKASQLERFSNDELHKELGLPLGIVVKIEEIIERQKERNLQPKPSGKARKVRGLSVTLTEMNPKYVPEPKESNVFSLTTIQIKLIKQTWLKVSLNERKLRRYFHNRLFKKYPELADSESESKRFNIVIFDKVGDNIPIGAVLEVIITSIEDVSISKSNIDSLGKLYKKLGITTTHYTYFESSLIVAIEKLTKRYGNAEDITSEFRVAWETFFHSLVLLMFPEDKCGTESPSPPSTPQLMRRAVMRKRSGTLGQLPITRSTSDSNGKGYTDLRSSQPLASPRRIKRGQPKQESSPKLFRARSITFKKKRKRSTSLITNVSSDISKAKESWDLLQPHMTKIISALFAELRKLESFSFATALLVNDNVPFFINYVTEWFDLAKSLLEDSALYPVSKFESGIATVKAFPLTQAILEEFYQVVIYVSKRKAKKVWCIAMETQFWSLTEYWFRIFQDVVHPVEDVLQQQVISLLRKSWAVINSKSQQETLKSFSTLLYKKLFEIAPHLRPLFQNSMDTQNSKLSQMITALLELIEDPVTFRHTVEQLGARHRLYKVTGASFLVFRDALLYALENSLSNNWNSDIRAAWVSFFSILEEIMKPQIEDVDERTSEENLLQTVEARIYSAVSSSATELNLCNYKMTSFPGNLSQLVNLKQLHLRNNNIAVISASIGLLENLEILDLSKNKLKTLSPHVGYLSNLKRLYLGYNLLKSLPNELGNISGLTKLAVNNNKLKGLFSSLHKLRHLVSLDASSNKMKTVPWQIFLLIENLKELSLTGNAFKIPSDINAIKDTIYTNHFQGESSSNTLKFALLGCEGAGKTSLLAALKGESLTSSPLSTDGIEISEWYFGSVRLSCLDFAGQEVYYDNHTLFLSPKAIHVLVFNMAESVQQSLSYWLRTLAAVAPDAPIFLVGTRADHKDSIAFPSDRAKDLAEEIGTKNLVGTFEVSCTRGTNIDRLRKSLLRLSTQLTQQLPKVPVAFIRLRELMVANREIIQPPILPWFEFLETCERCTIKDTWKALDFLQQEGIVMSLASKEIENNKKCQQSPVILDPSWLTEVSSALYSFSHSFGKADGLLTIDQLSQIWLSRQYAEDLHFLLIELLESFDIILRLTENKVLFPSFLPDNPPSSVPSLWNRATLTKTETRYIQRRFQLKFAPNGVFTRFLVKLIQLGANFYIWRSGIYWNKSPILCHGKEILVVFNSRSSCIDVFVSADGDSCAASALYIISQIVESSVCSLFTPENFSILVPLSGDFAVSLERLEKLLLKGGTDFIGEDGYVYPLHTLIPDRCVVPLHSFSEPELDVVEWKTLAAGSQASVERGQLPNGKIVACKNFRRGVNSDANPRSADILEAFHILQREAWALLWCKHPNVIAIHGVCISRYSIVMEFAPQGDLYSLLYDDKRPIEWRFALKISLDISRAMEYLHSQSPALLHRDLKSPNILLWQKDWSGEEVLAKIGDLGLLTVATVTHLEQAENPSWTAPEVMKGEPFTKQADVYSFGMVLYEIICRKFPFSEFKFKFHYQQMDAICNDNVRPSLPNMIPLPVRELIEACWQTDRHLRLDFSEISERLEFLSSMEKDVFTLPLSEIQNVGDRVQ